MFYNDEFILKSFRQVERGYHDNVTLEDSNVVILSRETYTTLLDAYDLLVQLTQEEKLT